MAGWTNPKTWTAAVAAVSDFNTHIRDNLRFLSGNGGGANSKPHARVLRSTDQSAVASGTAIVFDGSPETWDTGIHSLASNQSRLTCSSANEAGKWLIGACVRLDATYSSGSASLSISAEKNGSGQAVVQERVDEIKASGIWTLNYMTLIDMASTDYVECYVYHSGMTTVNVKSFEGASPRFWAMWMAE